MSAGKIPKMVWGASYANTATARTPFDNAKPDSRDREGSERVMAPSGVMDAWITGTDQILEGDWRWIPIANEGSVTGWDGSAGIRAMIEWLRAGNAGRWYGDKDVGSYKEIYLEEAFHDLEERTGEHRVHLAMISKDESAFTGY